MSEFQNTGEVKDGTAALNAVGDQMEAAVDRKLTDGGVCKFCGRARHENYEQLKPCVSAAVKERTA